MSKNDNKRLKVFFPGKFQPLHVGHLVTIAKLLRRYDVVVGITEDIPQVMSRKSVRSTLKLIFGDRINVVLVSGVLTEKKSIKGLPVFDILVSGNNMVLNWGSLMGFCVLKIPRAKGLGYSGHKIRRLYGING